MYRTLLGFAIGLLPLFGQWVEISPAPLKEIPFLIDGNSPSLWRGGQFYYFTSTGSPVQAAGADQFSLGAAQPVALDRADHLPLWIESVWQDEDGTIYGWYHHEPSGLCGGSGVTAPQIGAAVSYDGGQTFNDLGLILTSGAPLNCAAGNEIFGGGNGDFSVILDRQGQYFYFLFTHYGGALEEQGIVMARMEFGDRFNPALRVFKYYRGEWNEPGLGGHVTPVFPARVSWMDSSTDSYWGPAVHWNTYLESYVVLLNHSCCSPRWPQEGVYLTLNADLANPGGWTAPVRILHDIGFGASYYPQVMGLGAGETDTQAGEHSRLWVHGKSKWEIRILKDPPAAETQPENPDDPTPPGTPTPSARVVNLTEAGKR
jgi:hypothetical protein